MTIEQFAEKYLQIKLNDTDAKFPFPKFEKSFKKNETLLEFGQTEKKVYFLKSGIVEFSVLKDGHHRIIDFFLPNSFFCALTSFLTQKPTEVTVKTLSDCEVEYMLHADIQKGYANSLLANRIGRIITEQAYILKFKREKNFLTQTAEERYRELVETRPDVLQLVPVKKIAEYLGIEPESLSRIRKAIS